jgi:hypothetical protein
MEFPLNKYHKIQSHQVPTNQTNFSNSSDFTDSWLKKQDVYAVSERLIQDNKLIWHGSLEIPHDDEVENART